MWGALQFFAEALMYMADHRGGALSQRLALEVGPAEFGDDDLGVVAWRRDRAVQARHDPGDGAARRGGVAGNDRSAMAGGPSTTHEIELAARRAILATIHALGIAGALQVDLPGPVYRQPPLV